MKQFLNGRIKQMFLLIFVAGGAFLLSFIRINPNTNTPIIGSEHASIEQQTVETYANKYRNHRNLYCGKSSLVKTSNDSYAHVYLNTKSFGEYKPEVKRLMRKWNKKVGYDIFKDVSNGISLKLNYRSNKHGIVSITDTHNLKQGNYLTNLRDVSQDQIVINLPVKYKNNKQLVNKLLAQELKRCLGINTGNLQSPIITKDDLATIYHTLEVI